MKSILVHHARAAVLRCTQRSRCSQPIYRISRHFSAFETTPLSNVEALPQISTDENGMESKIIIENDTLASTRPAYGTDVVITSSVSAESAPPESTLTAEIKPFISTGSVALPQSTLAAEINSSVSSESVASTTTAQSKASNGGASSETSHTTRQNATTPRTNASRVYTPRSAPKFVVNRDVKVESRRDHNKANDLHGSVKNPREPYNPEKAMPDLRLHRATSDSAKSLSDGHNYSDNASWNCINSYILKCKEEGKYRDIITAARDAAKKNNADVDIGSMLIVIETCAERRETEDRVRLAEYFYERLKEKTSPPIKAIHNMLILAKYYRSEATIEKLLHDYHSMGYSVGTSLNELILATTENRAFLNKLDKYFEVLCEKYGVKISETPQHYSQTSYRRGSSKEIGGKSMAASVIDGMSPPVQEETLVLAAKTFISSQMPSRTQALLQVSSKVLHPSSLSIPSLITILNETLLFGDLTTSEDLLERLLNHSELTATLNGGSANDSDSNVISSSSGTMGQHTNISTNISEGTIKRLLQLAASRRDPDLQKIKVVLQLKETYGYPLDYTDYNVWVLSSIRRGDYSAVLEALLNAEANGFDLLDASNPSGLFIQKSLSDSIITVRKLDELYFAAVNLVADRKVKVPEMILNAILFAAARMGHSDRSFATFQEYEPLFKTKPSIHAYNALILASAFSSAPSVTNILAIFQEMEKSDVTPNSDSFSLLLNCMVETGALHGLNDIGEYLVGSIGIQPSHRALRKLIQKFALDNNWDEVDRLMIGVRSGNLWKKEKSGSKKDGDISDETTGQNAEDDVAESTPTLPVYQFPQIFLNQIASLRAKSNESHESGGVAKV